MRSLAENRRQIAAIPTAASVRPPIVELVRPTGPRIGSRVLLFLQKLSGAIQFWRKTSGERRETRSEEGRKEIWKP